MKTFPFPPRGRAMASVLMAAASLAGVTGCHRQAAPAVGPPLVVFIIDRTASTSGFEAPLVDYASAALDEYRKEGPLHVVLVNLTAKPSMDIEKSGRLTTNDVDDLLGHVKGIDPTAKGTDIITAFDKAYEYYTFDLQRAKPSHFRILCFTDGFIDSPKGQTFRPWSALDSKKLGQANAEIGVYFLDSANRAAVQSALQGLNATIEEKGQATDNDKENRFDLPGVNP